MLLDLPRECLVEVFRCLPPRDVLRIQSVNKTRRDVARQREVWEPRLSAEFGVRLTPTGDGEVEWNQLYARLLTARPARPIRFRGVFTDGGCDERLLQYWVDNMFAPNHYESFCSALDKNVNCIGLLLAGGADPDVAPQERRNYMIRRCRLPAAVLFADNETLEQAVPGAGAVVAQQHQQPLAEHLALAAAAGPLADADDAEMEDAEGQLQELAAPHADGVAAGIIAAAQQAAADLAELPALGGGAPAAGLNAAHDGAAAAASPPVAAGAGHAAAAPIPPAGPGAPPGGGQLPAGAGGAQAAPGVGAQAAAVPAQVAAAAAAQQQPGADDGNHPPPPPFWPEPQARWLSQSLTVRLLQRWTTAELENFLLSMWEEMLQGNHVGRLLLLDVKQGERQREFQKLHQMVVSISHRATLRLQYVWHSPDRPHRLLHTGIAERLSHPGAASDVGVVDTLFISRQGHFSCPCRTGAVMLGSTSRALSPTASTSQLTRSLEVVATERVCRAFNDVASRADLWALGEAAALQPGALPPIVAMGGYAGAEWVELDPDWSPAGLDSARMAGRGPSLRPVVWFVFNTAEEVRAAVELIRDPCLHYSVRFDPPLQPGEYGRAPFLGYGLQRRHLQPASCQASLRSTGDAQTAAAAPSWATGPQSGSWQRLPPAAGGAESASEPPRMQVTTWRGRRGGNMSDADGEELGNAVGEDHPPDGDTKGRNKLDIKLTRPHVGSLTLVKLIAPENLMAAWRDAHALPNIDMCSVAFLGRQVTLPPSVTLA